MDVISRRISLTAWGRLYGFDKATTSRLHLTGKLPPELQIEQLPNGRYYVVVPPENDRRCVVYARVSSADPKEDLDRQVGRVVEWATQQGLRPDEVVKEIGSGLNGDRPRLRRLVADHTVGTIVVEHRERLSRFGKSSDRLLVLQRRFKVGCPGRHKVRRGAWHGSAWPVRYYPAYPRSTAAAQPARTVPGAASPAPPGRPAAS